MRAILLPLILGVVGLGGGIGAGLLFALEPKIVRDSSGDTGGVPGDESRRSPGGADDDAASEFARMSSQFIVPVIRGEQVASLVVLSITIEVDPGQTTTVFQREPRLRDSFLRVLFDHANIGGFDAGFTQSGTLEILRKALKEAAMATLGSMVRDILIVDIVRQEV